MFKIKSDYLKKIVSDVCSAFKHSKVEGSVITLSTNAAAGTLTVSAKGKNISFEKSVEATVENEAVFYSTHHELQLKVSILPEEVYVTVTENKKGHYYLSWGRGNGILLLTCPNDDEVAKLESSEPTQSVSIKGSVWNEITRNVMPFSAAPNDKIVKTQPLTVGLNFEKVGAKVVVEATNGLRAIKSKYDFDWFAKPLIVPGHVMSTVTKLIASSEILTISTDENQNFILIESPTVKVVSKLLEGAFPDTASLYSDEKAAIVWRTDRMELIEVARRIKRLNPCAPVVSILTKENKCFASLLGVLVEQIGAVIETEVKEGFMLNAFNLEAALSVLRCEEVLITCNAKGKPVTFLSGDDDKKEETIVMLGQV